MQTPIYSARDPAITQRPTSTSLLAIDSEDRFKDYPEARAAVAPTDRNYSPYDFTIVKNESIMNGFFTRVGVSEVVFPWVIPNISPQTNTMNVQYNIGGGPVTVQLVLPVGFYTPSQIAAAIQLDIRSIAPALNAFTMTYGIDTTITAVNRPIFEYATNNPAATIAFFPIGGVDSRRKQLFDLLGFNDYNKVLALGGLGIDTFCQATRYIDIVCTQLTNNQALKDTMTQSIARDVLCRVYIGDAQGVQSTTLPSSATFCPPGCMPTIVYKNYATPKQIQWLPNQPIPGYLRFQVFDDSGFPLEDLADAASTSNWSMTLLVSEN